MKTIKLLLLVLVNFCLCSCVWEDPIPPRMLLNVDKQTVKVNEEVKISATIDKIYRYKETDFIFFVEEYPKKYSISKGTIFNSKTTDRYLCIVPELLKGSEGIVELEISFDKPGEYLLDFNICSIKNEEDYVGIYNSGVFARKIIVKE